MTEESIVTVTKKGQATIPKKLREKHKILKRVIVIDTDEGVLIKPVPDPMAEVGSLKELFRGKTSRQLIEEARVEEIRREGNLLRKVSK
ncbi:MAG: AbrB/MazE/SpoVT family DNA-binding domain-containing protein [Thaumarchaeota archaeon]|nr:AbrB/MazE/SpoVT family DNA-binding domain-containing protein [Nitrososphaerota archaeon]